MEDNERDLELTLSALDENNLANDVVSARDGAEALDYLYGKCAANSPGMPMACRSWSYWT